jgi:hypothetical protein
MNKLKIYPPSSLNSPDLMPPFSEFGYRFLAEGDSWFTVGALNPLKNSNLLFEMRFAQTGCAINCATPGDTLNHMSELNSDPDFIDLLTGRRARVWDGLLLSCGGNDLIDALGVRGPGIPLAQRLLREAAEWGDASQGAARYLSDAGWQTFSTYLKANLKHMVGLRDAGPSRGAPMFLHGYAVPMPRPAPAELASGPGCIRRCRPMRFPRPTTRPSLRC